MHKRTRGQDLSQGLDLAFSLVTITAFAGILGASWLATWGAGLQWTATNACVTVIICGVVGLSAKGSAETVVRGATARIYAQALQGFREPGQDRRRAAPATQRQSLADLGRGLMTGIRLAVMRRDDLTSWAITMQDQLALRRVALAEMEAALSTDTHIITEATTAARLTDGALAAQIQDAKSAMESVADSTSQLVAIISSGREPMPRAQAALADLNARVTEARALMHTLMPPALARMDSSSEIRRAVERLPGYSEAMGQIMRGLPELAH